MRIKHKRNYVRFLGFDNILDQRAVVAKLLTRVIIGASFSPFSLICITWKPKFHKDFVENILLLSSFLLNFFFVAQRVIEEHLGYFENSV